MAKELKRLFCEQYQCGEGEFEELALRECLYPTAKVLAPLVLALMPSLFVHERVFVQRLGLADNLRTARGRIADFHIDQGRRGRSFLRSNLKLRISTRRAEKLAADLFAGAGEAAVGAGVGGGEDDRDAF